LKILSSLEQIITRNKLTRKKLKNKVMNEYMESSRYFINLLIKWKVHFLIITVATIVATCVFSSSFFIPPKYKSFALIYPSNIISYSSETPSEQLLQLLESGDIRNNVISKFKLAEHYKIDTSQESGYSDLIKAFESNVEVKRTQFNSIEIKVFDTDPQLACKMVSEIINSLNAKARSLQREKTKEVVVIFKNIMENKKHQVDSIDGILQGLRVKYQLLDYEIQTKEVTRGYLNALNSGARNNMKDIDVMMRNLEEKGGEYYKTKQTLDIVLKSYNTAKLDYDQALSDLNKELTYTNIISKPFPADKKSYPIRWLIVVISTISLNLFLFFIIIVIDTLKPAKAQDEIKKENE
jgi:uncharacterized protein involved in exopolysaccharide biosynthesis